MKNMTIGSALSILDTSHHVTSVLMNTLRVHLHLISDSFHLRSAQPQAGDAAQAAGQYADQEANAMSMLNNLVLQAVEKLDVEIVRCDSIERTDLAVLTGIRDDVVGFSAMVAGSATNMNKAKVDVGKFEKLLKDTKYEFEVHGLTCTKEIADIKMKLTVVQADEKVMHSVVSMVECGDEGDATAATLMQCVDPRTNATWTEMKPHNPEWKQLFAKVQNPKVKAILANPNIFLEQAPGPVSSQAMDTAKCTVSSNPECPKIREKFMNLAGTVLDSRLELKMMLKNIEGHCTQTSEIMTKQIQNYGNILAEANEKLTGSTKDWNTYSGQKAQKETEEKDTQKEHTDAMTSCRVNIENVASEKCALKKIRGELLKMDKLPADITDCQVSSWVEDECSKSCGGGTQALTRSMTPGKGGAACPVGKAEQSCKEDVCPVDCVMEEWSEWGSCTALCGGGIKERGRGITTTAVSSVAKQCEETSESVPCNVGSCDADCELSDWSTWSKECSKPCGGGLQKHYKDVTQLAKGAGTCPSFYDKLRYSTQVCNDKKCPSAPQPPTCHSKLDVVLIVDGSGSMSPEGWKQVVNGTAQIAKTMQGDIKLSVLLFSGPRSFKGIYTCMGIIDEINAEPDDAAEAKPVDREAECGMYWQSRFSENKKTEEVVADIEKMKWPQATTLTSMALAEASAELSAGGRADAQSIVVVLTDGYPMSQLETSKQAEALRNKARLLWIPMGPKVTDVTKFDAWASTPVKDNVLSLPDFAELPSQSFVNKLLLDFCPDVRYGNVTLDELIKKSEAPLGLPAAPIG